MPREALEDDVEQWRLLIAAKNAKVHQEDGLESLRLLHTNNKRKGSEVSTLEKSCTISRFSRWSWTAWDSFSSRSSSRSSLYFFLSVYRK